MDSGSQGSYIIESLKHKLRLVPEKTRGIKFKYHYRHEDTVSNMYQGKLFLEQDY
jgi:hypothetical protein